MSVWMLALCACAAATPLPSGNKENNAWVVVRQAPVVNDATGQQAGIGPFRSIQKMGKGYLFAIDINVVYVGIEEAQQIPIVRPKKSKGCIDPAFAGILLPR